MKKHKILLFIFFPIIFAAFLIYTISGFLVKSFNGLTMEEIVFHLKVPMKGTSNTMFKDYFKYAKFLYLIFVPVLFIIAIVFNSIKKLRESTIALCSAITFALTCLGFAICKFAKVMNIPLYIMSQFQTSDFLEKNYVNPKTADISFPENKQNLIYIYLESMESTYASKTHGGAMNEELIPELYSIARENIHFSNTDRLGGATQTLGSTWTTGAMFTQSTGIPLTLPLKTKRFKSNEFLPQFTSIGDILEENGYNQEIIVGSDLRFGGRKIFYETHGHYKIFDYKSAVKEGKLPKKYYKWWGFEDSKLFEFAKEELRELSKENKPFNLTLLTADTHHIGGYKCDKCENIHDNNYENVLSCSSKQVKEFIEWIKQQPFYENTMIVLVGDHTTMDNLYISKKYDGSVPRRIYNCFINPSKDLTIHTDRFPNRNFNSFDLFPTTLAGLGAKWEGSRLGIGTNLFSDDATLYEKYGIDYIESELAKKGSIFE